MSDERIIPSVTTPRRFVLNIEDSDGGIAAVEITLEGRRIDVTVRADDGGVCAAFMVKPS